MNVYSADRTSRQATTTFVLIIGTIVAITLILGLGWWVWENVINTPLPYRDPEATDLWRLPHRWLA